MKFTTPCFVRVEDMEKRKELIAWLNQLGYNIYDWYWGRCIRIIRCWNTPKGVNKAVGYPCKQVRKTDIDCGENIELFKALAAMNDENDMQQLFICDTYANIGCVMWHLCDEKKVKHYYVEWEDGETDIRSEFRKATVEEIIKHFKKS